MWEGPWMEEILEHPWHGNTEISTLPTMIIDTAVRGRPDKMVGILDQTRPAPQAGWERVLREGGITVNIEDPHLKDIVEGAGACPETGSIVVEEGEPIDHTTDHSQVRPLLMELQRRPRKLIPSHQRGKEVKEVITTDQRCKVTQLWWVTPWLHQLTKEVTLQI